MVPNGRSEFLSSWLQRDRSQDYLRHQEEQEDDEESVPETATFSYRWRRFFRRLIRRLDSIFWPMTDASGGLTPQTELAGPAPAQSIDNFKLDYEDMYKIPELPGQSQAEIQQVPYEAPEQPDSISPSAPESQLPGLPQIEASPAEAMAPPPEAPPIPLSIMTEAQRMPEPAVITPETPEQPQPTTERQIPQQPDQRWWPNMAAAPIIMERTINQQPESPSASYDRQIQQLKMQAEQAMESQQKIERLIKREQAVPRIEPVAAPSPTFEQQRSPEPARPQAAPQPSERPVYNPNIAPATNMRVEQQQPVTAKENLGVAAERYSSTERVYEQRQEARDEPSVAPAPIVQPSSGGNGPTSVANILAAQQPYYQSGMQPTVATPQQYAQAPQPQTVYAQTMPQAARDYERQDMYQRAAKAGFWMAVALIIGAVLFYVFG